MFPASNPNERLPLSSNTTKPALKNVLGVNVSDSSFLNLVLLLIGCLVVGIALGVGIRSLKRPKENEISNE